MQITKDCADSLRSFSKNHFGVDLKSSHAHELVAAYMGYSSRAALLADSKCPVTNLAKAEFIVLQPTAFINARCHELKGLPQELHGGLTEGVYSPMLVEKWFLHKIWPAFEFLAQTLANERMLSRGVYFNDQKIQREGVKVGAYEEGVEVKVLREYVSPSRVLSDQLGIRGVVDVFKFKRVAGHIGYVKANHYLTEAETLDAAIEKMEQGNNQPLTNQNATHQAETSAEVTFSFPDWLNKQKNRNSPLGDLARKREFDDKSEPWPAYTDLKTYLDYLTINHPPMGAMKALEKAWKTYQAFLKRKVSPNANRPIKNPAMKKYDLRTIVSIKNVKPLHYTKRTVESFVPGDKAWISWDGKKAIPVTVLEADEIYYTFRLERPLKKVGSEHYVRLDEVRSTPELACLNCVTL